MTHETRVFVVASPTAAATLQESLSATLPPDADWRPVPHARFSVKADGVVITCYRSGKVVVQGKDLDAFAARHLPDELTAAPRRTGSSAKTADAGLPWRGVTIGSDEAGKGDYFGPLVVAAALARPTDADWLADAGVTDSKAISDGRSRQLAALLEQRLPHRVIVVDPPEYNERYATVGNLNVLLAELHAECIADLLRDHDDVEQVIVDRFARDDSVRKALVAAGAAAILPALVEVPRAEQHGAVAAASILARAAFLDGLARCEEVCGSDVHKGAGAPTEAAARRVYRIGGRDLLSKVAKLHFKTTDKVAAAADGRRR